MRGVSASAAIPLPAKLPRLSWWRDLAGDWAVVHGIKTGMSALLALFVPLVLQLDNPTWSLLTVFVLAAAPYVGAMAEKGFLRILGTLVGGILGMLIVSEFEQNSVICLGLTFIIVAYSTYKYGGDTFPYAFFLCGLTTTVVVGDSLGNPDGAWSVAVTRFLEISIGVCASLLINSLFWPRYAVREFRQQLQTMLGGTQQLLDQVFAQAGTPLPEELVDASERTFTGRLETLRQMIHFGACESNRFRQRVPSYSRILTLANGLHLTAIALAEVRKLSPQAHERIIRELQPIYSEISAALQRAVTLPEDWPPEPELAAALTRFDEYLHAMKNTGKIYELTSEEILPISAHYLGLRELVDLLEKLRGEVLNSRRRGPITLEAQRQIPGTFIENFWIHNGIKGGLVTVISLIFVNWLNPPGGTMIPLAAWVFTILSRVFLRSQGDRRSFQYAFYMALLGVPYMCLLLVLAPVLSSYAAANLIVFACFFVFGYLCVQLKGITYWMQIGMFAVISMIGLNPQSPVGFQQIVDAYFGVVIALFISAIVQRFLWPVTPQLELRHCLIRFLEACRNILRTPNDPQATLWRKQIALASSQATAWVEQFTTPEFPPGEITRWQSALSALRATADQLRVCMKDACKPEFEPLIQKMTYTPAHYRERHDHILNEFQKVIAGTMPASQLSDSLEMPLADEFKRLRDARTFRDFDLDLAFRFYGHIARCQRLHGETLTCIERLKSLKFERYMGDYAL